MYTLNLTEEDLDTIHFVGNRYGWAQSLLDAHLESGANIVPENVAWSIRDGIDEDMEGNHDAFPMLDSRSELAEKLYEFYNSIV